MIYVVLRKKIQDLLKSNSTLLWLEGAKYEQVQNVQLKCEKLILSLSNGTIKLIQFDKYAVTLVGIQFWSNGRPGVLYKWDMPNINGKSMQNYENEISLNFPDDDPPPNIAA